ncbi:M16 family metallopeptidase [Flavilitoribacter nigricans]|nr:pitrilysin family protein [Flavilitoribacter nigricans]
MNFRSYILFFFLVLGWSGIQAQDFRNSAPKPGPAPKIEIGDYETFTLKNGLTGIVVENHKLPRVSFQLFFDLPLIAEGDMAGAADIAGDLISKGTTTRKKAEIDEAIDFIGASLNTGASAVSGASLTKHKDKLMEVLADVVLNPSFPEDEFEKIKKQTLSALAQSKADPNSIAANVARVLRYGSEHPYGELTTEETVNNITLEDAKAFYNKYFVPSRAYFVVVGDITARDAENMAKKYFSSWNGEKVMESEYPMPERPASTQVDFVDKAGAVQSVITITYPIDFSLGDDEAIATSVMNTILGGGFSGRLNLNLREDKAYTYGAGSQTSPDKYVGNFNASASVRNEVTDSAILQFMKEIEKIRSEPVSDKELQQAKSILAGSFARNLEQPQTVARFALNTVRYDLPENYYATYLEKLSKVTKEDVTEAARQFIHPENAHILVVGNKGEVADKLARFDSDGEVNFYDAYGQKVEMEEMGLPEDMSAQDVIDNYVAAIGGADKLQTIKDMTMQMSASIQGQNLETVIKRKAPDMMAMEMTVSGMTLMSQKYDGQQGKAVQQGQAVPLDEAALAEMKIQATLFPETRLEELGYQMELKGLEMLEGKKAYAVEMISPTGNKSTEYFDISNGLKIRSVVANGGQNVVNDYDDYREVDGIKFPFKTTVSGMMPFPLTMEVQSLEVNTGLEAAEFAVE